MFKNEKINLAIFTILMLLQLLGVAALWTRFELIYLPAMLAIYLWVGLGTTLYLHRYLTHRGFEMAGWLKLFFATGSAVGLAGDPVTWWATIVIIISNPIPRRIFIARGTGSPTPI